jgi:hypothetical protein
MLASGFYHRLHIVQLQILSMLTGEPIFAEFAEKWTSYTQSAWNTRRALAMKVLFKICCY